MFNLPDQDYYQYVIRRFLETRNSKVSRLPLAMIDLSDSKQNALPSYLWGLIWADWQPPNGGGRTVFLTDYADRGPNNALKRTYYSAVTPDLYASKYRERVEAFFARLLGSQNRGQPIMHIYLSDYWDLYWSLHLGVTPGEIPSYARDIGETFNACLADIDVFAKDFHDRYMQVRDLRPALDAWLEAQVSAIAEEIAQGSQASDDCFVYYWLVNGQNADDVVFECFHNFLAFSQWGHSVYRTMDLLRVGGDPVVRTQFEALMRKQDPAARPEGCPFSPLDLFVMELFRTITPNGGSISAQSTGGPLADQVVYTTHDHRAIARDPLHWRAPDTFNPDRFTGKPTSADIDEAQAERVGFATCPFAGHTSQVADGRSVELCNSGYGTVYAKGEPVVDDAGYSPFGFGYRRCPGEQLTVAVIEAFLTELWAQEQSGATLEQLELRNPQQVPVGPGAIVTDNIGLVSQAPR